MKNLAMNCEGCGFFTTAKELSYINYIDRFLCQD